MRRGKGLTLKWWVVSQSTSKHLEEYSRNINVLWSPLLPLFSNTQRVCLIEN